jgi:hypothetical protein
MEWNVIKRALVACWIASLCPAVWAGDSVLYSITDKSVVVVATNRASKSEYAVPESKTDIFAIDPETGKKRLVFSDANAGFVLLQPGNGRGGIVAGGGRIFAFAMDRQDSANDRHSAGAIYELSTDGSGKTRRIFDLDNFANLFVNPSGSKIGYMPGDSTETHIVIRDTATGKQLLDAEIFSRTIEAESAGKFGWMLDNKRIFFALGGGLDDEEGFWTTRNSPIGTYVMNEDSGSPVRLAPEAGLHPKIPGMEPSPDSAAVLIAVLPDSEYLLSDNESSRTGNRRATCLYMLNLTKKTQKIFTLVPVGDPGSFYLSPSGSKVAFTVNPGIVGGQPKYSVSSTVDVWVLDMESGKQSKLFSFTTPNVASNKGPWMNLIGWLGDQ